MKVIATQSNKSQFTQKLVRTAILALVCFVSFTSKNFAKKSETDSTIINVDKRNQVVVGKNNNQTLRENIQALMAEKGMTLNDETWKGIRKVINSDIEKDTLIVITQDGKSVNIAINTSKMSENKQSGTNSGNSSDKKSVKIGLNGVHVIDGTDEVHVSLNGVQVKNGNTDEVNIRIRSNDKNDTTDVKSKKVGGFHSRNGFNLYLGLNSYTGTGSITKTAEYSPTDFELSALGSRFVAFGWTRSVTLSRGTKSALKMNYGLEFSWNNFMFDTSKDQSKVISKGTNGVKFTDYQIDGKNVELCKSKMTAAYLNFPVMFYIAGKRDSKFNYIGFGGHVGYLLDSYTKTKEDATGNKQHDHSSLFLNKTRYGLDFEINVENFPTLFVNYDLNTLFQDNRGPKLNTISFGIRL
jgi:Outer membrane protein beta-barrel domain